MSLKILLFLLSTCCYFCCGFSQVQASLSPHKETYRIGDPISLNISKLSTLQKGSWTGLYHASTPQGQIRGFLTYKYIGSADPASLGFQAPVEPGEYEFRIFDGDPGTLSEAIPFTVAGIDSREVSLTIITPEVKPTKNFEVKMESELEFSPKAWLGIYPAAYALIEQIAQLLLADAALRIRIEGHTDSQGEEAYNQSLSERRCQAISEILTPKYGVPATQLESQGYGESKPIEDNDSPGGRAKNRRVELVRI